jgi:hypothetical protein
MPDSKFTFRAEFETLPDVLDEGVDRASASLLIRF